MTKTVISLCLLLSTLSPLWATTSSPFSLNLNRPTSLQNYLEHTGGVRLKAHYAYVQKSLQSKGNLAYALKHFIIHIDNQYMIASEKNPLVVLTLISDWDLRSNSQYPLVTGSVRDTWLNLVAIIAERYDGDAQYGCNVQFVTQGDCYFKGDGLKPDAHLSRRIRQRPVNHLQIESNWLEEILPPHHTQRCEVFGKRVTCGNDLINHFVTIAQTIKKLNPKSKIITPAFRDIELAAFYDGLDLTKPYVETGDDCSYQVHDDDSDPEGRRFSQHLKQILKAILPFSDVMDFQIQLQRPENLPSLVAWIRRQMGVDQRAIWSTSTASPVFYFDQGVDEVPSRQVCASQKEKLFSTPYYNPLNQADKLIQIYITALSTGIDQLFYHSILPNQTAPIAQQRMSQIDERFLKAYPAGRKPAYYTWIRMQKVFSGFDNLVQYGDGFYQFTFPEGSEHKSAILLWKKEAYTLSRLSQIRQKMGKGPYRATELVNRNIDTQIGKIKFSFAELYQYLKSHPGRAIVIHQ